MDRGLLPFVLIASPAARKQLGRDLGKVAVLAMQALLRQRKSVEVAHQQLSYRKQAIAFSSRVGRYGDLLVLESDLRRAELEHAARHSRRERGPQRR
jgi:hypothetical protein